VFRTFVAPALGEGTDQSATDAAGETEATLATRVRYDGGRLRLLAVGLVTDGDGDRVAYASTKGSGATTTLVETDGVVRMAPETSVLAAGSTVAVERFDDAPIPTLLGVGDPDPAFWRLLDGLDRTRYLRLADADAGRWLADGIPDVAVTGEPTPGGEELAGWRREWGLVVPQGNPAGLSDLGDLADGGRQFANLDVSISLRDAFDERLEAQDVDPDAIDGYHRALPGIESPARSVAAGRTDVGLGLRATATDLDLGFVPVGSQRLTVTLNRDRTGKASVQGLRSRLDESLDGLLSEEAGYESVDQ
jgi:putative molybdopterin biosynthesis protein